MPRKAAGLTAATVEKAGPGRYADGGGVYLLVRPGEGGRFFLFRYNVNGTRREMGLGPAGGRYGVKLADARDRVRELLAKTRAGIDPIAEREAEEANAKAAAQTAAIKSITFAEAARKFIATNEAAWRNPKHHAQPGSADGWH